MIPKNIWGCKWDERIWSLWNSKIVPKFKEGETCSSANYFAPRPYVDTYNRGSSSEGFTYTVQPGN